MRARSKDREIRTETGYPRKEFLMEDDEGCEVAGSSAQPPRQDMC